MPETWYAHPNDLIGGWSVMNRDYPPSGLNRATDPNGREVATFMSEADARRIADLHNADLAGRSAGDVDAILRALFAEGFIEPFMARSRDYPDDDELSAADAQAARDNRDALRRALAGRLLPEGGETREEWFVGRLTNGLLHFAGHGAEGEALARRERDEHGGQLMHRWVTEIVPADEVGPWVAVDQEDTDG